MNARKLFIALVVIATLSVLALGSIPKNVPILAHFLNKNSLELEMHDGLELDKLQLSISITATEYKDEIIFDGKSKHTIPKEYGENDWYISYDNKYSTSFRHFKTNNWHDHNYSFNIRRQGDGIVCNVKIEGPDRMETAILLLPK